MNIINKKLSNLKNYKVYDYSVFDKEMPRNRIEVSINRAVKKDKIVKAGKGKFYKRDKASIPKKVERINNPSDRSALRYNRINPSKYAIFSHLFWSNKNKPIPLDNYIARILEEDVMQYVMYLRYFFGDRKVIEVYLNNFYKNNRKEYVERVLSV